MASDFTKTPLTLHPMFMKDLEGTDCLYINIEDNVKTYQSLCQTLKRRNVVDAVAVPLYGVHEPIGFILLMLILSMVMSISLSRTVALIRIV